MKNVFIWLLVVHISCKAQNPFCDNDFFHTDTSKYFLVNEVKPIGDDRFIEIWNCRTDWYHADTMIVVGVYSHVADTLFDVDVPSLQYMVLPAPLGLRMMDGIKIMNPNDTTSGSFLYAMVYTLLDNSHSVGFCENGYCDMIPSPGVDNNCSMLNISSTKMQSEYSLVSIFDMTGRCLGNTMDALPPGLYVALYESRHKKRISRKLYIQY